MDLQSESIFTQLIFERAMRIRLKSESKNESAGSTANEDTSESVDETFEVDDRTEPIPEGGHVKAKTANLIGKINNLVTTDISTIQSSSQVVTLRESR